MSYLFREAGIVRNQIEALKALYPEMTEDADLLAGMIEGETDLGRVLDKVLSFVRDAQTNAAATKARKDEMGERQKRFERQEQSGRKIILQLMEAAGQARMVLPEATLSITAARTSVNITDVNDLPQGFYATERKPLSNEIKTALEKGERIPGAELVMGECGLMVRTK
jgi:hypothetical protein